MPQRCLADTFGDLIDLTASEQAALAALEGRGRTLRRGAVLLRENDRLAELFALQSGMMMSYVLLDDGSRQILRFLFPGDLIASAALVYAKSPETIVALTEATVAPIERAAMTALVTGHPRLAAMLIVVNQIEAVAVTDRLAALGRTSARTRVAALLIEIRNRMRGTDDEAGFMLGLTQEEIGDATGLTAVHVNRMMRRLEEDGLIARENGRIRFLDERRIARVANYVDRFDGLDLGWLPAAR